MTYEYVCTSCGHAWEAEQSISAAPLKVCPNCGQEHAKRQASGGAGFILKGGGWYADGYGSSKGGGSGSSSSGSGSSSNSGSASKTETSSETKSSTPSSDTKTTDSKGASASTS